MRFSLTPILGLLCCLLLQPALHAGSLSVQVTDAKGNPVAGAAVYVTPAAGAARPQGKTPPGIVLQKDGEFAPLLTIVQTGTAVTFPNEDKVKHHVYSFSPAKKFELPLYAGTPDPVVFDRPGVVALGCNIHDWMIAYVLVVDTPFFKLTGPDGRAELTNLPAGNCRVEAWHPRLRGSAPAKDSATGAAPVQFQLDLKPEFRIRRSPTSAGAGYR